MSDSFQRLRDIAPKLCGLTEDLNARVHYELMSDGLVWSDELPPWEELEPGESSCLRGIWQFRTSLITGAPVEKFRTHWEEAQKLFPNWPGFLPNRQSSDWRDLFVEQQAKLSAGWEELDARYERQKARNAGIAAAPAADGLIIDHAESGST